MKLLPIVPGCRALFTGHTRRSGQHIAATEVTIGKRAATTGCSRCSSTISTFYVYGLPHPFKRACSCNLLRIDGDPDSATREQERELTHS